MTENDLDSYVYKTNQTLNSSDEDTAKRLLASLLIVADDLDNERHLDGECLQETQLQKSTIDSCISNLKATFNL